MELRTYMVFKFEELDKETKQKAIDIIKEQRQQESAPWSDEVMDSLKAVFEKCNGIRLKDWSIGSYDRSYIRIEFDNGIAGELMGKRAIAWLENNFLSNLRIGYNDLRRAEYRKYGSSYYAGQIKPCPLTGVCFDDDFINGLREDIEGGMTLNDAFHGLANTAQRMIENEEEYYTSDESIKEYIHSNDFNFLENGKIG